MAPYCNYGSLANDRILNFKCGSLSSKSRPLIIFLGLSISHASKRVLKFKCGFSPKNGPYIKIVGLSTCQREGLSFEKWPLNIILGLSS